MEARFKLISANDPDLFEERLNRFVGALALDDIIVSVEFSTAPLGQGVEYSALVHYQQTEGWQE
jgi:hypothetical protein